MRRLLIALALGIASAALLAPREPVAPTDRVRGASLGMFASEPDYDYAAMIDEIADRGATDLLVVIPWSQSHRLAVDPGPGSISPTPSNVERTLRRARRRGLRVGVMPIVRLPREARGRWRGTLAPTSVEAWFASYDEALAPLAELAEREDVGRLVIGSELLSLERHDARWRRSIAAVRARFGGLVSYATNWDDLDVPFADALDEIGVSAYFPMSDARAWADALDRLRALGARTGRPVILTEVGYPSRVGAGRAPWREDADARVDVDAQARLLLAFCRHAAEDRRIGGYYVWNWFGWGGPSDGGYSPRGKPGAAVLERCWAERVGT